MSRRARACKPCSNRAVSLNVRNRQVHCREGSPAAGSCSLFARSTAGSGSRHWMHHWSSLLNSDCQLVAGVQAVTELLTPASDESPPGSSLIVRAINHRRVPAQSAAWFQSLRHSRKPARLTQITACAQRATKKPGHVFCRVSVSSGLWSKRDQQVFRRRIGIRAEWAVNTIGCLNSRRMGLNNSM